MNSTPSNSHEQTPTPLLQEGMTIGTQESQPETTYYDLLGVPVDATIDDIKNAYRASMCYPSFILSRLTAPPARVQVTS